MRKQLKAKLVALLFLLVQAVMLSPGTSVRASTSSNATPLPFAYSNASSPTKSIIMSGTEYSDAILFTMGYTGIQNGYTAQVTYNFKGAYQSLSFTAGFVSGDQRDAKLTIIADEEVLYDAVVISYINIAKRYTIPLSGVSKLTIRFDSSGYNKTQYAIGDISAVPTAEPPSDSALISDEFYDIPQYLLQNAQLLNEPFSMGGYNYENGYLMKMGYTGNRNGYTSKVSFNFKEQYKQLSFDIAKYMNGSESYTRPAFLTIEVDGQALPSYTNRELTWDELSIPITIDLNGVSQVTITTESNGYNRVCWAIGNIQLVSDGHAHGVLLSTDQATLTSSSPSVDLNPRVYPSDAQNTNLTIRSDSSITAIVEEDGVVYGRHKGTAVITATTEDGGHTATCTITSKLPEPKYVPSKDGWGFTNTDDIDLFGENGLLSGYYDNIYKRISGRADDYANKDTLVGSLEKIYGDTFNPSVSAISAIANSADYIWYSLMGNSALGGLCHGYSVASALTYTGDIPFSDWDWGDGISYDVPYDVKELDEYTGYSSSLDLYLKQMLFACHITQGSSSYYISKWASNNHYTDLIDAVKNFQNTDNNPVVLTFTSHYMGAHTVLPYEVLERENDIYVFVYDPNHHRHLDPDSVYIKFIKDDNGEIIDWFYRDKEGIRYQKSDADISFLGSLSTYADRMKEEEENTNPITKFIFTTAKRFSVVKNNETLLTYNNGVYSGDTSQSIAVPFVLSASEGNDEGYSGTAIALFEDTDIKIVLSEDDTRSTTIYYTPESACIIECDSGTEIDIISENETDLLNILPSQQGDIKIRYNTENTSVITNGNVSNVLSVNTSDPQNAVSFKGYSDIQAIMLIDDKEIVGEKTTVSPNGTYFISENATVSNTEKEPIDEDETTSPSVTTSPSTNETVDRDDDNSGNEITSPNTTNSSTVNEDDDHEDGKTDDGSIGVMIGIVIGVLVVVGGIIATIMFVTKKRNTY